MPQYHRIFALVGLALPATLAACNQSAQIQSVPTWTSSSTDTFAGSSNANAAAFAGSQSYNTTVKPAVAETSTATGASPAPVVSSATGAGAGTTSVATSGSATSTGTGTLTFAEISTAVANDCGGGNCHGQGSSQTVFVNNQAAFDSAKQSIISQLSNGFMPPPGSTIPGGDLQLIEEYCSQ